MRYREPNPISEPQFEFEDLSPDTLQEIYEYYSTPVEELMRLHPHHLHMMKKTIEHRRKSPVTQAENVSHLLSRGLNRLGCGVGLILLGLALALYKFL